MGINPAVNLCSFRMCQSAQSDELANEQLVSLRSMC